jgi:TorA maturation chaperone TorD
MAAGEPAEDAWVSHGGVETTRHRKNEMGLRGFRKAVYATGAMKQYARRVGNSRPLAPGLMGSPAVRELSVDTVMNVARDILWPDDACEERSAGAHDIDEIRAQEYSLLAMLLSRAPGRVALNRMSQLRGDMTPLGVAHGALAQIALDTSVAKAEREFFDLFIGIGRGELLPYGSYYLTGFLNERPLARLREDLRALHIERAQGQLEPEDHAAILCEIMAGLVKGPFATTLDVQRKFFEKHVSPWIGRFFADLERTEAGNFYRRVGTVGRTFMEIEDAAFRLPV